MRRRTTDVLADPELVEMLGHDPELLAIADAIAEMQPAGRYLRRRPLLVAGAVAAVLLLVALPAVAAFTPLIDFSGAPKAEGPIVQEFADLKQQAPPGMDPRVIASETRRLEVPLSGEGTIVVYVAPTHSGGYCFAISGYALGCDANRTVPAAFGLAAPRPGSGSALVYGLLHDPAAARATINTAQGSTHDARLVRVTRPIDASVFVADVPDIGRALPLRITVTSRTGDPIATRVIEKPPAG